MGVMVTPASRQQLFSLCLCLSYNMFYGVEGWGLTLLWLAFETFFFYDYFANNCLWFILGQVVYPENYGTYLVIHLLFEHFK